jgi:hypothetical protein
VTASDPDKNPACGRLDPARGIPLFTSDTKSAVENCKEKAIYLVDPLPLEDMYDSILPNPNSTHQLTRYLSKRGESNLESFHDRFAHFANCGTRSTLADNLNLAGTARYNLAIRHKRRLILWSSLDTRKNIPALWEEVVPYQNHSELWHINTLAASVGAPIPFPTAKKLPKDNGERFFLVYLTSILPQLTRFDDNDCCLCTLCDIPRAAPTFLRQLPPPDNPPTNSNTPTVLPTNNNNVSPHSVLPQPRDQTQNHLQAQTVPLITNTVTNAQFVPTNPPQLPALAPYQITLYQQIPQATLPLYFVPPILPCCSKYAQWLRRRVGRPPHDCDCPHRRTQLLGAPG